MVEEAKSTAETAEEKAVRAEKKADDATVTASEAKTTAEEAKSAADTATATAHQAQQSAEEATKVASEAKAAVEQAVRSGETAGQVNAEEVKGIAEEAKRKGEAAEKIAQESKDALDDIKQVAGSVKSTAEEAKKVSESAQKKAVQVETVADEAGKIAKEAKQTAGYAKHDAEQARNKAQSAENIAYQASNKAGEAKEAADGAKVKASLAESAAEEAKKTVGTARTVADEARDEASAAKDVANNAKSTAEKAKETAEQAKTVADEAKTIAEEANKSLISFNFSNTSEKIDHLEKGVTYLYNALKLMNLSVVARFSPFLVASQRKGITVKKGTIFQFSHTGKDDDENLRMYPVSEDNEKSVPIDLEAGKDYYLYLVADNDQIKAIFSDNATYPDGYTANNSVKIGGFHTLCADVGTIDGHPLSGYQAGDILPNSVWCLNHRPHSSPEGMVYDPSQDLWVDIYLQSGTGENTRSAYGVPITTNRSYTDHVLDMRYVRKSLLNDEEFSSAMYGSNEKTSIQGKKAPSPKVSGGHVDTADRRMISHIGCEDGCGYAFQYLSGSFPMHTAVKVGSKYQLQTQVSVLVAGGGWSNDRSSGCFARVGLNMDVSNEQLCARGCSHPRYFV
ncbi:hypothetical protein [Bartonella doshiae]|uniref:phage major tropism determinant n=1 Tax=Bartonella doshiae TaxID=33044 RepID=UPI000B1FD661|nr:hypothetical protein [Bartonella doshiae]